MKLLLIAKTYLFCFILAVFLLITTLLYKDGGIIWICVFYGFWGSIALLYLSIMKICSGEQKIDFFNSESRKFLEDRGVTPHF